MPWMYSLHPVQVSQSLFTGESLCPVVILFSGSSVQTVWLPVVPLVVPLLLAVVLGVQLLSAHWWGGGDSGAFSSSDSIMAVSTHPYNPHTTHKQCSHFTNNPEQFIIHLICLLSHHNSQAQIETDWDWIHNVTEQISRQSQRDHLSKAHCWWWMVCSGYVWNGILASCLLNTSQYELHIYLLLCITILYYTLHYTQV